MAAFDFHRRRTRRWWYGGATLVALAFFTVFFVSGAFADQAGGCDFSPANNGTPLCAGPLTGSTFEGGDGNLVPNATGATDWSTVAGRNGGVDLPSGTGDNAFGQGTKEDNSAVTVVSGSIPPNKSDLTRFYEASEFANNSNFLYLAWERTNVLGSANMDFEINQATTPGLGSPGAHTINRTAGDLLVTFDFTNGGGTPTLGLLTWVTSGSTSQCFSSNSLPCWGNHVTLNGTNSEGAVNNIGTVTDPIAPDAPRTLAALTFGEAAINLTAADVFPSGSCEAFGSTFLKSRASAAFGSEVKDFVAPIPVNISNCGTVNIIKHTDPRGVNQDFSYTSTIPNPATGSTTPSCTTDTSPSAFTLNDNGNTTGDNAANTEHCANVPAGNYTVTEGTEPANFTLEHLTCTATGTGSSGSQDTTTPAQANITVAPGGVVTCTYVNQGHGALKITKTNGKGGGLNGAVFTITGPNSYSSTATTATVGGVDGVACVDGLAAGSYTVTETSAPAGYAIDNTSGVTKAVSANGAACSDTTFAGTVFPFTDSPLSDIQVNFKDGGSGKTSATISCDNTTGTTSTTPATGWDTSTTVTGVHAPTTVKCTITIDP